jgi:hypothetical protein
MLKLAALTPLLAYTSLVSAREVIKHEAMYDAVEMVAIPDSIVSRAGWEDVDLLSKGCKFYVNNSEIVNRIYRLVSSSKIEDRPYTLPRFPVVVGISFIARGTIQTRYFIDRELTDGALWGKSNIPGSTPVYSRYQATLYAELLLELKRIRSSIVDKTNRYCDF